MNLREDARLHVSLDKLDSNFDKLHSLTSLKPIIMVKANAYGHGMESIYKHCSQELEQSYFGVASLNEAIQLRAEFPQINSKIYVFSEINFHSDDQIKKYNELKITPVVHCLEDLKILCTNTELKQVDLVLKINTGMNRLGINSDELEKSIEIIKSSGRSQIDHLLTHYASSYLPINEKCLATSQWKLFNDCKKELSTHFDIKSSSTANSGAIEQKFGQDGCDFIRPGLMLYGPQSSFKGQFWNGEIISRLEARVLKIKKVQKGDIIGYGETRIPADGWIMYLPIGYGDGVMTQYRGAKINLKNGTEGSIFGRVNMDITFIYQTNPIAYKEGEWLSLWGDAQQDLSSIIKTSNSIPYEIFTNVSKRIPRVYSHSSLG